MNPDLIPSRSLVYSFGVGEDVSFELALIQRFGADVFAFDPTPAATDWIARQRLPSSFHFRAVGLAGNDGTATFHLPQGNRVSYTMALAGRGEPVLTCPVARLATILKREGHERIDVLKLDIEGAEWDVIPDIAACSPRFRQVLVEFHHQHAATEDALHRTEECIDSLVGSGFELFNISPSGREFSFLRRSSE